MDIRKIKEILDNASCQFSYVNEKKIIAICNEDVDFFGVDLVGLEEFRVFETPLSNVGFLSGVDSLRIVDIHQTKVGYLEPIGNSSVEYLDLSITPVNNLDFLANMHGLRVLKLSGLNIDSIESIRYLNNLEELHIDFCYNLESIEPIRNLKKLLVLNIAHTNIKDLSPLIDLAKNGNLEDVDLTDTNATPELIKKLLALGVRVTIRAKEPSLGL